MLNKIFLCVLIVGGINWGLIGVLDFDLVAFLFGGQTSLLSRAVYTLVGISALGCIPSLFTKDTNADTTMS